MGKKFERALLLCPMNYSLFGSFKRILSEMANEVNAFDVRTIINKNDLRINSQIFRVPYTIRKRWEAYFLKRINREINGLVNKYEPDIVLVYNSVFLLPETCREISNRAKLVFFMGDSPFYTPQNNYYLPCLNYADLILSPDSFWNQQLNTIGLLNTIYFVPGLDESAYFEMGNLPENKTSAGTEILYVGSSYLNSWGYKKALLMSKFTGFKFEIHGNSAWRRWFSFFPALEKTFFESGYLPQDQLNRMYNMTSIIPVDGNPGILNGFHIRLFEALGAGALPLIEYRFDIDNILFSNFKGELPVIKDYNKAAGIASYYLANEQERKGLINCLKDYVHKEFNPLINAEKLVEALNRRKNL